MNILLSRLLPQEKINQIKAIFPALFGTILEYYDYALFGFCASLIYPHFFVETAPTVALLKTFGIFLAGSFAKPLGALIFGFIGDNYGRSLSLKISMLGIAVPTFAIGFLPAYQRVGWIAPLLLLICRILQGICTAGESDGARIYIYEWIGKKYPCFANSLSSIAAMLGIYFASVFATQMIAWEKCHYAWRIPFWVGGLLGIVIAWYRKNIHESLAFIEHQSITKRINYEKKSLKSVLWKNKYIFLAAILLCGATGGGYHFYLVFLSNFFSKTLNIVDPVTASLNNSYNILIYALFSPIAGLIADKMDAFKVLKYSSFFLLGAILLNVIMLQHNYVPLLLQIITTLLLCLFLAPGFVVIFQRLSIDERFRCASFGHAIGSMLFSGSAPFISLWLWYTTKMVWAPFLYFVFLVIMGLTAVLILQKKKEIID